MMREYALVSPEGDILDRRAFDDASVPAPGSLAPNKPRYLPVEIEDPPYDPALEVREGPVETVEAERVLRAWTISARPIESLREDKLAAAAAAYDAHRQSPMTYDFGATDTKDDAGVSQGPAGEQTLQMRESGGHNDIQNWLAVALGASLLVGAGAGAVVVPIKTTANVWVQTTAAQVLQALIGGGPQTSALQRGTAMLAHYGAIKQAIAEAAEAETLAAIDVDTGWPV